MPNVAHKPNVPLQESEATYASKLFTHREATSALDMGSRLVADTAVGETVELNPMHRLSVHEIYTKIAENFKAKSQAEQAAALVAMEEKLGVELHDASGAEVESGSTSPAEPITKTETVEPKTQRQRYEALMRKLSEDIYDALQRAKQSLAIIKPKSVGDRIHKHLHAPGDANFLVARGEGENLLNSLRDQDADFRVLKHNKYGFVMENKELGFRALFVFQERIDDEGNLTAPDIEETEIPPKSAKAKENTPEATEGNVAGATTAKNERATVAKEDHMPDAIAQFAARKQQPVNDSNGYGSVADFGDAANVTPLKKVA